MISVIGGGRSDEKTLGLAEEVGRCLARRGATVVCGGLGGVMEAVCRGARAEGGHTVGILPGHSPEESEPNPYVEFPIYTGIGYARNVAVVLSGEAVIAIDGSYGTLSELAFSLIHGRPIIGLGTWNFNYHGFDGEANIIRVTDPEQAVEEALVLALAHRSTEAT